MKRRQKYVRPRHERRATERDEEEIQKAFGWIAPWFEEALFNTDERYSYADLWSMAHTTFRDLANQWNRHYPNRKQVDPMGFAKSYPENEAAMAA